jgi:subtilase family serine protease
MRKVLLIAIAVLVVSQLSIAQVAAPSAAMQQFNKALSTGKPQLVMPMAAPGTHARSLAMFSGKKLLAKSAIKPSAAPGEPWFCDWNNGSQILVCPKGVQTAYGTNFPGANGGQGMTVAIVDYFYYVDAENALAQYNADMGLPPCTVANGCFIPFDLSNGNECLLCFGWEVETMLDIEAVHAMAPKAKIVYIGGDPYNYGQTEELLAQALGIATSNSWTFNAAEAVAPIFEPVLGQGPPTLFASGDGSWFPSQGIAYPCTSTQAVCVGGTSLYLNPNLTRNSEPAWSGAGGGCSGYFAMPTWQNYGFGSTVCSPNRAAPDVAAIADPNTGFAVYIGGYYAPYYYGVGGTSLATPILAGLVADIDTARLSFGKPPLTYANFNPEVYGAAAYNYNYYVFDVVSGSNGYPALPGFDLVTGLGVPNGKALGSRWFGIP